MLTQNNKECKSHFKDEHNQRWYSQKLPQCTTIQRAVEQFVDGFDEKLNKNGPPIKNANGWKKVYNK